LRNPPEILLGAFDNQNKESFESTINLEDTLKTTFPLIHIYTAWGSKEEQQFPALQVKAILELGSCASHHMGALALRILVPRSFLIFEHPKSAMWAVCAM
jgi:hypothetical protein